MPISVPATLFHKFHSLYAWKLGLHNVNSSAGQVLVWVTLLKQVSAASPAIAGSDAWLEAPQTNCYCRILWSPRYAPIDGIQYRKYAVDIVLVPHILYQWLGCIWRGTNISCLGQWKTEASCPLAHEGCQHAANAQRFWGHVPSTAHRYALLLWSELPQAAALFLWSTCNEYHGICPKPQAGVQDGSMQIL